MIFKNIFDENSAKQLAFWAQNKAKLLVILACQYTIWQPWSGLAGTWLATKKKPTLTTSTNS
jgi:hypothetical protein